MSRAEQAAAAAVGTAGETEVEGLMRAVVQGSYGDVGIWRLDRIARPDVAAGEVLVRVHAAGMDRGTWHMLTGRPYLMRLMGFGFRRPKNRVPGFDMAGEVVATGQGVTRFAVGDRVFGMAKGSFAEYAAALEDKLAHLPEGTAWVDGAALGISGSTALQAVSDAGRVQAGQRVLVIGASGGVGSYAVQIAKAAGAEVTGVASTGKLDFVRSLGADHVLDYTQGELEGTYDLVVDIGGNRPTRRLRRLLTRTGTLVIVGGETGGPVTGGLGRSVRAALLSPFVKQRLVMLASKEHHSNLERLAQLVGAGRLRAAVDRAYPLAEVATAMRRIEDGSVRGKLVITP
jgi:NADPH:quinone reductase-like Zn-dependent oxidoreductase